MLFPRSGQTRAAPNTYRERESAFPKSGVTLVRKKRHWLLQRATGVSRSWALERKSKRAAGSSIIHYNPFAPPCFRSVIRSVALARVGVVEQDFGRQTRLKRFFLLPTARCQSRLTSFHCSLLKKTVP